MSTIPAPAASALLALLALSNLCAAQVQRLTGPQDVLSSQKVLHSFQARTTHRWDPPPVELVGDVDGDGLPDFALGQAVTGGVEVRRGVDGMLLYAIGDPGLKALYATALARLDDVDGDGVNDFAVGSSNNLALGSAGFVELRSGAGGTLLQRFPGPVDESFGRALIGFEDLDGDGAADLIVATPESFAPPPAPTRVQAISSQNGTAMWTVERPNSDLFGSSLARIGDLDGDGVDEIAATTSALLARDTLILSGASGAVVRVIHDAGGGPQVNLGDLDGDGLDELAVADLIAEQGQGHTGVVRIFRCVDGTLLRVHRPFGPFGAFGAALAAGDIDRDGVLDLIVGQSILEAVVFTGRRGAVLGYSGAHAGLIFQHLGPPFPVTKAEFGNSIAFLGDANGDGVCSLVATGLFPTGLFSAFGLGLSCR